MDQQVRARTDREQGIFLDAGRFSSHVPSLVPIRVPCRYFSRVESFVSSCVSSCVLNRVTNRASKFVSTAARNLALPTCFQRYPSDEICFLSRFTVYMRCDE